MQSRIYDRIDEIEDIEILSKLVCQKYNFGNCICTDVIEIGYEDFNAIITAKKEKIDYKKDKAEKKDVKIEEIKVSENESDEKEADVEKYFMKVFRNSRDANEIENVIQRVYVAEQNNVKSPKIYKNLDNEIITNIDYKNSKFRLAVMEYIDGYNFLQLNKTATIPELRKIASLGSSLNKIDYKPEYIYDSWAISSFCNEFEKKKKQLEENIDTKEYLKLIQKTYEDFKNFDYSILPKSFVHGDISKINLMQNKNGEFYIVDFSVANYTARLNEIVVICNNFGIIPNNKKESERRIRECFNQWANNIKATYAERKSFKTFFEVLNSIYILNASYEKANNKNNSPENDMYLELGLFGMSLDVDMTKEEKGMEF
jgi:Ser/Thr protein kinase RdoA (MazF antagonist)